MVSKNDFERLLSYPEQNEKIIEKLQKERIPLVLWGAGDVASAVKHYLELNHIVLDAVWIDGLEEESEFEGIPMTSFMRIKEKYPHFNVILGHSNFDLGEILQEKESQINKVYYLVSIFYEQYENIPGAFVQEHIDEYYQSYRLLSDEESEQAMIAYLNARMNNDIEYVKDCFSKEQTYFCNDIYQIGDTESYVDVGAFNGDTIQLFLAQCKGKYEKIFAFEPERKNFKELQRFVESEKLKNILLYQMGTWNKKDTLYFTEDEEKRSSISLTQKTAKIPVDRLDQIIKSQPVSLLKINFLHGVLETLEGAANIIKKYKPKLAIVVGFDEWALINIPQYISKLVPEYNIYIRYNRCMPACLTLYAEER